MKRINLQRSYHTDKESLGNMYVTVVKKSYHIALAVPVDL